MLAYLLAQTLFFAFCFGYFTRRIVPQSVVLAFVISLMIFSSGFLLPASEQAILLEIFSANLFDGQGLNISFSGRIAVLFTHAFVGAFLGLVSSLGAYLALLVEKWIVVLLFGVEGEMDEKRFAALGGFRGIFPLLALVVFFAGPSAAQVFQSFTSSYLLVGTYFLSGEGAASTVLSGKDALLPISLVVGVLGHGFQSSFAVLIPFFLVAFAIDLFSFFYRRVFLAAFSQQSMVVVKLTVLLFLLALSLMPFRERISTLERGQARELVAKVEHLGNTTSSPLSRGSSDVR